MPSDEYQTVIGGGLKLKGSKPSGVGKTKKKKKPKAEGSAKLQDALAEEGRKDVAKKEEEKMAIDEKDIEDTKTPAQRRHEEIKRKRLDERLEREGVKSHKEKVEELNKYLSKLSEHHDMPKIGPG